MAKQYGASGNADAVFYRVLPCAGKKQGKVIKVDEQLHNPIDQALGIVAASKHPDIAQQFIDFLLRGKGATFWEMPDIACQS